MGFNQSEYFRSIQTKYPSIKPDDEIPSAFNYTSYLYDRLGTALYRFRLSDVDTVKLVSTFMATCNQGDADNATHLIIINVGNVAAVIARDRLATPFIIDPAVDQVTEKWKHLRPFIIQQLNMAKYICDTGAVAEAWGAFRNWMLQLPEVLEFAMIAGSLRLLYDGVTELIHLPDAPTIRASDLEEKPNV